MSISLRQHLTELFRDPDYVLLAESIFGGPADPGLLEEIVNGFCRREFDSAVRECLRVSLSVGGMFGLHLENGMQVALKIHRSRQNMESLKAVTAIQQFLHKNGFPCPKVLKPPSYFREGSIATTEEYVIPGEYKNTHDPDLRGVMAEKLAEHIHLIRNFDKHPRLLKEVFPADRLFPEPHNVLFNFGKTRLGAEWIDTHARSAQNVIQSLKPRLIPGHCDWSGKHFRFDGSVIVMIYDWDSLRIEDELEIIGHAAATFTTTWEIPVRLTPTPEECFAFVRDYETARKKKFSRRELRKISASALYILAYSARCEHARDPEGLNIAEGSFRDALQDAQQDGYFAI